LSNKSTVNCENLPLIRVSTGRVGRVFVGFGSGQVWSSWEKQNRNRSELHLKSIGSGYVRFGSGRVRFDRVGKNTTGTQRNYTINRSDQVTSVSVKVGQIGRVGRNPTFRSQNTHTHTHTGIEKVKEKEREKSIYHIFH